jgi:type IV pilus assembly protein PilB
MSTPHVELDNYLIDENIIELVPEKLARRYQLIPLFKIDNILTVAMADPHNIFASDEVRLKTKCEIEAVFSTEIQIKRAIDHYYGVKDSIKEITESIPEKGLERSGTEEAPAVKFLNLIIAKSVRDGASDIHLEPDQASLRIRYRIDGILHEVSAIPKNMESAIISRVKVMGDMDIAENRVPQDGRFCLTNEGKEIELRISSFPTIYGECIVLRILDQSSALIELNELGFSKEILKYYDALIERPHGIVLVTGPTGSGKTTTLYASLNAINCSQKSIITIEDPVEYRLNGIRQSQINPKAGMTFAGAMRSVLRQDPDVIMVGEIRDLETAQTATGAAITGHLVFSTLHTNDAPEGLTRLMDIGVKPYLISSSVVGILAQRLVRTVCPKCKEPYHPKENMVKVLGRALPEDLVWYRGKGCKNCSQTGYKGRIALFELLVVTDPVRDLVSQRAQPNMIRKIARETHGMKTLFDDGIQKAMQGITTIEEVTRLTVKE